MARSRLRLLPLLAVLLGCGFLPPSPAPADSFAEERQRMVEEQIVPRG